jgi:hypothetical protein
MPQTGIHHRLSSTFPTDATTADPAIMRVRDAASSVRVADSPAVYGTALTITIAVTTSRSSGRNSAGAHSRSTSGEATDRPTMTGASSRYRASRLAVITASPSAPVPTAKKRGSQTVLSTLSTSIGSAAML